MSAFVIKVGYDLRTNFDRAVAARVWDTKDNVVKVPILAGDRLYFWVTGTRVESGLVGVATATSDLRPLEPGDKRPWVQEDTATYGYRVELGEVQRVETHGFRWGDIPSAPKGQNPVIALPEDSARWLEQRAAGFTVVSIAAAAAEIAEMWMSPPGEGLSPAEMAQDMRDRRQASIVARRGSKKFRGKVLRAYRWRCAISGSDVEAVLDAAHIMPFKGAHTDDVRNGLLLRTDLHTLFDLHQLAIVGDVVHLAPHLRQDVQYGEYHGKRITLPDNGHAPKEEYLASHREKCDWLVAL